MDLKCSHNPNKFLKRERMSMLTMWGDSYVNYLDYSNHFAVYTYKKTSGFSYYLYTLFICKFYLNKTEK